MKRYIERIGKFYSHIILENVGLFIAYGMLSIIFSTGGWIPLPKLKPIIELIYLIVIPLLISYSAGKRMGGTSGGLIATMAWLGFYSADGNCHILGAILIAPIAGWIAKKGSVWIKIHAAVGFEMISQNFFVGIGGGILLLFTYYCLNPGLNLIQHAMTLVLDQLFQYNLVPFMSLFIEPGKIMFLNNTINHGLLVPLGMEQVNNLGSSILFLLETNPGPGLGILLACFLVEKKEKKNLFLNMIIQFFGGIHELYFPYVLLNSRLFFAVIAGGIAGNFCFLLFPSGLTAPASPGSILTILLLSPTKNIIGNLIGIAASAAVSCFTAMLIIKRGQSSKENSQIIEYSKEEMVSSITDKGKEKKLNRNNEKPEDIIKEKKTENDTKEQKLELNNEQMQKKDQEEQRKMTKKIYFVCQGGFGSSAMGAAILRRKLKAEGLLDITVSNTAIDEIPDDADVIFCQKEVEFNLNKAAITAQIYCLENLSQSLEYDQWILEEKQRRML